MKIGDPTAAYPQEQALDAALAQALQTPRLPADFRTRLAAALSRATTTEAAERRRLDKECRERLLDLEAGYVRLRGRTLGTLIGGAFAAGVAVVLLMPWFTTTFGSNAMLALASFGALVGVIIGSASWMSRLGFSNPLDLF